MDTLPLYRRLLEPRIAEALSDTPAVLLAGPRQAGKTTLARKVASEGMRYLTLDDESTLLSAKNDPVGFIRDLDRGVIDEIQRAPNLLLAIKKSIDEDRRPGRFLLTGSANLMVLPTVADSLAGRMETLTLMPLSQSELHGNSCNWVDAVFTGSLPDLSDAVVGSEFVNVVLAGGYPEAIRRHDTRRRTVWVRQYIDAIVQRDVRDVASIEKLDKLPRFLRGLAEVSGQLCNYTRLGGYVGLDGKTADRYTGTLELLYLLKRVEPWAGKRLKRLVKTPKLQFMDSCLLATLLDLNLEELQKDRVRFGSVLESFVFAELFKHTLTSDGHYRLLYYRDVDMFEVDVVIENASGQLVGVEVKASATVSEADFRGLKKLAAVAGDRFRVGVLLYDGTQTLSMGEGLWAAPLSTLWGQ